MSLCPSSSHQLVAAAIAFRRARRKFPKDFGLETAVECAPGNTKAETATSRERSINQAKSSSSLTKHACNVCPASVRNRDYDNAYSKENSISCSCCRTRNGGEDISELRDECSGGDAIDTVPSREFEASGAGHKNEFVKSAERDRCDVASRTTDDEATKTAEWIPQSARSTFHHHCKAGCSSKLCSNLDPVNFLYDSTPREWNGKIARGDFPDDRDKEFALTSCRETSIDLDNMEERVIASDVQDHGPCIEDAWKFNTMNHRKIVNSTWRCHCEHHPRKGSTLNLLRSTCDRCCDGCHHHHDHHRNCFHRHYCCQRRDHSSMNAKEEEIRKEKCETYGKAQHKSWRDQMRGENSRLYARQCYSKDYSGIISASRERNDEKCNERGDDDDDNDDDDDDDGAAVINHKDSMCILAEKYKAGRRCRGRRCGDKARSGDRTGARDEYNKSLTSEIIDQLELPLESVNAVPHEGPSVKHVCHTHCENCGTTARTCSHGCSRHTPPEGESDRFKPSLNGTAATHCCSSRAPYRRVF